MNKFYYQGILVRSSEREYTHAVVNTDGEFSKKKLVACSGSYTNALKVIQRAVSERESNIRFNETALKAMRAGKPGFMAKSGTHTYPYRFEPGDTEESLLADIERVRASVDYITKNWKVVELTKGE